MRLLYNILFPVFFLLSAPYYFWKLWRRGNWRAGFGQRFGGYGDLAAKLRGKKVLWLHAVSVGEANLSVQLVEKLRGQLEGWTFVVSTTTTTGMGELARKLPADVHRVYYPVDWMPFVRRAFRALNPAAIVLVEAEIWPNLFWRARDVGVPMHLVNARLSEKSFRGYRRFGVLFRPLFASLQTAGVHNEADAKRLAELGTESKAIAVTGNMKFDGAFEAGADAMDARALLQELNVADDAPVLVAGSTFEGEEILLAELLPQWREAFPNLFLILVPRHFERAAAVLDQLKSTQLKVARRTAMEAAPENPDVLLVDSTGELKSFFKVATVVFMGKSLTAQGGQNPIEPAAAGRAIVFGPFMQNFRAVVGELLAAKGAVQVADEGELAEKIPVLLGNLEQREALGEAALGVVSANKGASQRTADWLGQTLRALAK
ncbi:MAG: 3-deoxy-D-manno-octulosonic acid transferase [Verrucomicrobia subdivision 3 bacterium]|nr:3-deoxy-D-manno-octulosonic acid transferase [Limisphaerales bacterium]